MWAIDETIDGGDASVVVSAINFQKSKHVQALSDKTMGSILQSPRLFSKFNLLNFLHAPEPLKIKYLQKHENWHRLSCL